MGQELEQLAPRTHPLAVLKVFFVVSPYCNGFFDVTTDDF
jgi:hypothetical protein